MKGAGKGVTREWAIRNGASEEITRGTHLMAVYPALFLPEAAPWRPRYRKEIEASYCISLHDLLFFTRGFDREGARVA